MKLLDVVALTQGLPEHGLVKGQVGTIIENFSGDAFEIEFASPDGLPYAMLGLKAEHLMILKHQKVA